MAERRTDVWAAHPGWAAAVRIGVVLVPLALSVGAGIVVARHLPLGSGGLARVVWWGTVFVASSLVLFVSDRLARRLLPLAVLLELSLVFPDRAPSRMRTARTSSVRDLEDRLAKLRARGTTTAPLEAAETLVTLVGILGLHDKRTRGHSERVRALVDLLTDEMGLPDYDRARIRWAALVHDLGKLSVPAALLNKPSELDADEWDTVRSHPDEGVRLVAGLLPWLGEWGRAVGEHHERWDGLGYPNGLAGEDIALGARIVAVADSYEVMTSARSYSRARSASVARRELTACAGAQFDPMVVRSFLSISLGRLRWVVGPVSWLAQVPFLALDGAGQAARLAGTAAGVGGLAVAGTIAPPAVADARAPVPRPPAAVSAPADAQSRDLPQATLTAPAPSARATASARAVSPAATASRPATSRAPRVASPAAKPVAAPAPSTYWFTRDAGLAPTAPTATGAPPDVDGDGRPGRTLLPTREGLATTRATERYVLTRVVDAPLRLVGEPVVVLWSRLLDNRGNGRIQVRLDDCTAAGSCTTLSDGQVVDGTWSPTGFEAHEVDLAAVDVTVAKGHRLRLTIVANANGTSDDVLVGLASRATPSRLVLPVRR